MIRHAISISRRHLTPILAPLVAACVAFLAPAAHASVKVGDAFPSLTEAGLSGADLPATSGKVLYVDFWASWCAPCKASFPALEHLNQDLAPKGVVIVAVGVDDKQTAYEAWVKKFAPEFTTVHDATHNLVSTVEVPTMPTSFVIGRDGRVRAIFTGYHGAKTEDAVRAAIEAALAEPVSQ